jgi:hypothetical protein
MKVQLSSQRLPTQHRLWNGWDAEAVGAQIRWTSFGTLLRAVSLDPLRKRKFRANQS